VISERKACYWGFGELSSDYLNEGAKT